MSVPAPSGGRTGTGRIATGAVLISVAAVLGFCGLGTLAYGGMGAIMVHESQDDPWVVWSLVIGAGMLVTAVGALVVGLVLLIRRR